MKTKDKIAFILWLGDRHGIQLTNAEYDEAMKIFIEYELPAKTATHFGDCTNDPCPCSRCWSDILYESADLVYRRLFDE